LVSGNFCDWQGLKHFFSEKKKLKKIVGNFLWSAKSRTDSLRVTEKLSTRLAGTTHHPLHGGIIGLGLCVMEQSPIISHFVSPK